MATCARMVLLSLAVACFVPACQTTTPAEYQPSGAMSPQGLVPAVRVAIDSVSDQRRDMEGTLYWMRVVDRGHFAKPVAEIVQEAVTAELRSGGLLLLDEKGELAARRVKLQVKVLEFSAVLDQRLFASNVVRFGCSLKFTWRDAETGAILEENTRGAMESTDIGTFLPSLPMNAAHVREYGRDLIDSLLPDVIRQELASNSFIAQSRTDAQLEVVRLAAGKEAEALRLEREKTFRLVQKEGKVSDYQAYLARYPEGADADWIREHLPEAAQRERSEAFRLAKEQGSAFQLMDFLDRYPAGEEADWIRQHLPADVREKVLATRSLAQSVLALRSTTVLVLDEGRARLVPERDTPATVDELGAIRGLLEAGADPNAMKIIEEGVMSHGYMQVLTSGPTGRVVDGTSSEGLSLLEFADKYRLPSVVELLARFGARR